MRRATHGPSSTPGSRRTRSWPARGRPAGRCHAAAAAPGAGRHERRDHRSGCLAGDVPDAVRAGRRPAPTGSAIRGDPRGLAAVAERGEQVRSQFRGAHRRGADRELLARRAGDAGVRRERRILFDGVRAEIHPYDVTVERDGAAEAYDCKWGARGHQRRRPAPARRRADATPPTRTSGCASASWCSTPSGRAASAWSATAPRTSRTALVTLESLDRLAVRRERDPSLRLDPRARRLSAPYRVRFDEAGPDGRLRTSVLLRYAQDLAWHHSRARASIGRGTASAAWPGWCVRPRSRCSPRSASATSCRHDPGRRLAAGVGPAPDRLRRCLRGAVAWIAHRLGAARRAGHRPGSPPSSSRFRCARRPFELAPRVARAAADAAASRASRSAAELDPMDHVNNAVYADWLEEPVLAAGGVADIRSIPRGSPGVRQAPPRPVRRSRRRDLARPRRTGPAGSQTTPVPDLLRARLELIDRTRPTA